MTMPWVAGESHIHVKCVCVVPVYIGLCHSELSCTAAACSLPYLHSDVSNGDGTGHHPLLKTMAVRLVPFRLRISEGVLLVDILHMA